MVAMALHNRTKNAITDVTLIAVENQIVRLDDAAVTRTEPG